METKSKRTTILHVEDDPDLARLAQMSLSHLGFHGEILQVTRVAEAIDILMTRASEKAPLDLILLDMQLPDGVGLDVLRQVKASPVWNKTPVIFLSSETDPKIVNEAYALGANCYLPKNSRLKGGLGSLRTLYECWIEGALTPTTSFAGGENTALTRGAQLRTRTAKFYLGLARCSGNTPEQESFWLERALVEGNMSNLLTFLYEQTIGQSASPEAAERTAAMQLNVETALSAAERFLARHPSTAHAELWQYVVELLEAWDEEVVVAGFGLLFPHSPAITMALKARGFGQIRILANLVLEQSHSPDLCRRAEMLIGFADRLERLQV